jgi:hypothetical protein
MGTTLTGTTPQDTYDSLIKVTNNGPLSSTARYLSDGLGNDSALALSTGDIGVGYTSPTQKLSVAGNIKIAGAQAGNVAKLNMTRTDSSWSINNETDLRFYHSNSDTDSPANIRVAFTSVGNVGIGTNAPAAKLQTTGTDAASVITGIALENFIATNPSSGNGVAVDFRLNNSGNTSAVTGKISTVNTFFRSNADMVFSTFTSDTLTEKVRIQSGGGISFNGDTAAANALDDYEEGTFTPTLASDGTGSFTLDTAVGKYTKIGNTVHVSGYVAWSANTCTGNGIFGGLPFAINYAPNPPAQGIFIHEGTVTQGTHFRHDGATSTGQGYSYSFGGSIQNASIFGSSGNFGFHATYFV